MPAALTSTPLKIGAFTVVSSVFSAGIAAIALTYSVQEPPFGGAPVFEVELIQYAGLSAPVSPRGSTQAAPPTKGPDKDLHRETQADTKPAVVSESPSREPSPQVASPSQTEGPKLAEAAPSGATATSQPTPASRLAGSPVTGDERRGAATQGAQGGQQTDTYEAQVIRWLEAHKKHPGRLAGVVTVKFVVDRRGRIRDSLITKSSGDARLDRIAQQQLREAGPLPRPPLDVAWQTREITVSLDYRLHA